MASTIDSSPKPILRIRTPRVEIEEEGPNEKYKYIRLIQRILTRLGTCFFTTGLFLVALFAAFWNTWFLAIGFVFFMMAYIFTKSAEFDIEEMVPDIENQVG